jgi:hypothetical protein
MWKPYQPSRGCVCCSIILPRSRIPAIPRFDVTFNEDRSRLGAGHGAKNMAVVRHFALNLVRQIDDKRSIKRRRKRASCDPQYLLEILGPRRC